MSDEYTKQAIVVQKYGGSSVRDPAAIAMVAERVAKTRAGGKRVVVVVSAMGKTTDGLLQLAAEVNPSPPRRELDMLLTAGERISMALLSMALQARGVDAISFTGSQSGILTNDAHAGARIVEVRPYRLQDELARGRVVIVAGYQGVSYKKEVTTLGRGGSDTTAVALAAALGAEYCEICSDVDGIYNADPRVVEAATLIKEIGASDMLALADGGAKVLHRACIDYARAKGISLWARATSSAPLESGDGSLVRVDRPVGEDRVLAVAHRQVRRLRGAVADLPELLSEIVPLGLGPFELNFLRASSKVRDSAAEALGEVVVGAPAFEAIFAVEDIHAWPQALQEQIANAESNATSAPKARFVESNAFLLTVVGSAFDRAPLMSSMVLEVLENLSVEVEALFASSQRVSVLVETEAQAILALQKLHQLLFNEALPAAREGAPTASAPAIPADAVVALPLQDAPLEMLLRSHLKRELDRSKGGVTAKVHTKVMETVERTLIQLLLEQVNGNPMEAARRLGMNRNTLRARLDDLDIELPEKRKRR